MGFIPTRGLSAFQAFLDQSNAQQQQAISDPPAAIGFQRDDAVVLEGNRAGQQGLSNFLANDNNAAAPVGIRRVIQPVLDLGPYQRVSRFSTFSQALNIGERLSQVRWVVPIGEYWEVKTIWYQNTDNVAHTVQVLATINTTNGISVYKVCRTDIAISGTQKVIYGTTEDSAMAASSKSLFQSKIPVILEPGDTVTFEDVTGANAASTPQGGIHYDLVPEPAKLLTRGVAALVTVA